MNETDLPCSDCGSALTERTIPATDLPLPVETEQPIQVAICPSCEARYYPEQTLTTLAGTRTNAARHGDR